MVELIGGLAYLFLQSDFRYRYGNGPDIYSKNNGAIIHTEVSISVYCATGGHPWGVRTSDGRPIAILLV
jgi:hypothetical protein